VLEDLVDRDRLGLAGDVEARDLGHPRGDLDVPRSARESPEPLGERRERPLESPRAGEDQVREALPHPAVLRIAEEEGAVPGVGVHKEKLDVLVGERQDPHGVIGESRLFTSAGVSGRMPRTFSSGRRETAPIQRETGSRTVISRAASSVVSTASKATSRRR
jgi:hypothetical protein